MHRPDRIWYFADDSDHVDDVKSLVVKRQVVHVSHPRLDVGDARFLRPALDPLDHLGLDVDGHQLPLRPQPLGGAQRIGPAARAHFEHHHPRFDAVAHGRLVGRLELAPQRMIDQIGQKLRYREFVKVADNPDDSVQDNEHHRCRQQNAE